MTVRWLLVTAILLGTAAAPAAAQHGHGAPVSHDPPVEPAQFQFIIGQWEIVAEPHVPGLAARIHGAPKFIGTWKAWPALDGWGIEDEIRLLDASGNPRALTQCVRVYDSRTRGWKSSSLDVYRATFTTSSGEWRNGEMHFESQGTDAEGKAYKSRTRFHAISASGFRFQQDRSYDDGKSWTEGMLKIAAKRVAATAAR